MYAKDPTTYLTTLLADDCSGTPDNWTNGNSATHSFASGEMTVQDASAAASRYVSKNLSFTDTTALIQLKWKCTAQSGSIAPGIVQIIDNTASFNACLQFLVNFDTSKFAYYNGSGVVDSTTSYVANTYYDIDIVVDFVKGTWSAYVNGTVVFSEIPVLTTAQMGAVVIGGGYTATTWTYVLNEFNVYQGLKNSASKYSLNFASANSQYDEIVDGSQTGLDITGNITMEMWARFVTLPSAGATIGLLTKWNYGSSGQNAYGYWLFDNGSGTNHTLGMFWSGNGTNTMNHSVTFPFKAGVWYHIAVVTTVATHTTEFFVNGKSIGTSNGGTDTSIFNGTNPVRVGAFADGKYANAMFKEVRLWNTARTATQIRANAGVEIGTDTNLKAYWKFNNAHTDSSGNGNTLTANGTPVFVTEVPFLNSSAVVDNVNLLKNIAAHWGFNESSGNATDQSGNSNTATNTSVTYSTGKKKNAAVFNGSAKFVTTNVLNNADMAVSAWFKTTYTGGSYNTIIDFPTSSAHLIMQQNTNNYKLQFETSGGNVTGTTQNLNDGNWHHVVIVAKGTTGYLYVDGVLEGTGTISSLAANNTPVIGMLGAGNAMNGSIDEMYVAKRTIGYGEVLDLYNSGNAIQYGIDISVAGTVQSSVFSAQASTITAKRFVNIAGTVQAGVFSTPARTVTGKANVAPNVASATFSIPLYDVMTPDAMVNVGVVSAIFSTPASTVTAKRYVSIAGTVQVGTFSIPAYSIKFGIVERPSAQSLAFTVPTPTLHVVSNINVSAVVKTLNFSIPSYSVVLITHIQPSVFTGVFTVPAYTVTAIRNMVVSANALGATFSMPRPRKMGGLWSAQPRDMDMNAWTPQARISG